MGEMPARLTATLLLGSSLTACSRCWQPADPSERTHTTVLARNRARPAGCGARFDSISGDGAAPARILRQIRPDLEVLDALDAELALDGEVVASASGWAARTSAGL